MKILIICSEVPFCNHSVVRGNSVRTQGLLDGLKEHHIDTLCCYPSELSVNNAACFSNAAHINALCKEQAIDVILVSYWQQLTYIPDNCELPVILDCIAPRLLEAIYQPEQLKQEAAPMISLLSRADRFLVGNQKQADFLLPLLILAGVDCRAEIPIDRVPIAALSRDRTAVQPNGRLRLIFAGVDWPWRDSHAYLDSLESYCSEHNQIEVLGSRSSYPQQLKSNDDPSTLKIYSEMITEMKSCHIGLEVSSKNSERQFSQSFRIMEYLNSGLPVIVNSWLPFASTITQFDAGWTVDNPDELIDLIKTLEKNPKLIHQKSIHAIRLIESDYLAKNCCKTIARYLKNARKLENSQINYLHHSSNNSTQKNSILTQLKSVGIGLLRYLLRHSTSNPAGDSIVMITRSDLFPTDHGAAVKIIETAKALSHQVTRVLITTDNRRHFYSFVNGVMTTHNFPIKVRLCALPRVITRLLLWLRGFPMNNSFLYAPITDWSYFTRGLYLAKRFTLNTFIAEFPAYVLPCAWNRRIYDGHVLLVEHNVEHLRLKQQIPNLQEHAYQLLKSTELAMCELSDTIITVSDQDRQLLIRDGVDSRKIQTIPHGVDLSSFQSASKIDRTHIFPATHKRPILVYHGTYGYQPNLDAVHVLADEILPRLAKLGIRVNILAIGRNPPTTKIHDDIHFTDSVDSVAPYLCCADIAVVPLLDGGGTRMKILDYFAAGVPVVSTSKGIEGIPVTHGIEAIIEDDFDAFALAIQRILKDPSLGQTLVRGAKCYVDSLDWRAITNRYLKLIP